MTGSGDPPELANPGNVFYVRVGGGTLGHPLAYKNEAPMPVGVAERFIVWYCPPGGIVANPFCGSGTTAHAAIIHGRRFIGCDIRESQVELTARQMSHPHLAGEHRGDVAALVRSGRTLETKP